MSYRNAIHDIAPGSLWACESGFVRVMVAAAGHVSFGGMVMHERAFRAAYAPLYDRAAIRQQFTMSLANLGEFRVYWLPSLRRIVVRSVSCRRQFRVPDDAILVGTYSDACPPADFFAALDEIIVRGHGERERGRARA